MVDLSLRSILVYLSIVIFTAGCGAPGGSDDSDSSSVNADAESPISFAVDRPIVAPLESVTLSWSAPDLDACSAAGDWSGDKATSGDEVVGPLSSNSTFVLTCYGIRGAHIEQVNVTVTTSPPPTVSLSANPANVVVGGSTVLTWTSANATSCTATGDWSGSRNLSDSETLGPINTDRSYTLTCTGIGGTASDSVTVTANAPASPVVNLSANPLNVAYDGSTTLTWSTSNVDTCAASGSWTGNQNVSGTRVESNLTSDQTYVLTCSGAGGSASDSITINVAPPPAPAVNISASPLSIVSGESTTLTWSSSNADSCAASGDWSGNQNLSGSRVMTNLTSNSTFVLTCSGVGGTASDSVSVSVVTPPAPTLSFTANPQSVLQNSSTSLSWTASHADTCTASDGWSGNKGTSGTEDSGSLSADVQFTLTCTGPGGMVVQSVQVTVVLSGNGTATASWNPPTTNTDGSTLTDLAGYKIYYGTASGVYDYVTVINDPGLTSYVIENLLPGDWYFAMTAFNSNGIESSFTPEATKTIN